MGEFDEKLRMDQGKSMSREGEICPLINLGHQAGMIGAGLEALSFLEKPHS
jgi:hypothetical protein